MKLSLLTSFLLLTSPFALADEYAEEWEEYYDDDEEYGYQEDPQEEEEYYWELLSEDEIAAQDSYYDEDEEEEAQAYDAMPCHSYARPHRIVTKHREGNGIGYPRGYTSLDGFFSYSYGGNSHPFIDLRAHLTNDGKWAYNAGVGFRTLIESIRTIFGLNFFYDYRDGRHRPFNQVGAGLELLGKRWDLRLNGYIPVGQSKKKYFDGFRKFRGNHALFAKRYEVAMDGFDVYFGGYLFKTKEWNLHAKLGGYYFHGDFGKMFGGGLFELATDITRYITLKGQVSYDSHFKWIGQGEAALNFPIGPHLKKNCTSLSCGSLQELEDRFAESVDRFEMIVTIKKRRNAKAINTLTGQPLFFVFVDNTSSSAGTFESPFPTLAQAQNLNPDVIYVFPGDGTDKGLNAGVALQNNQALIGSAAPFLVTTRFGLRTIPPQTIQNPHLSFGSSPASPNPVIILANNNNVSGFTIVPNGGINAINGSAINGAFIGFNNFYTGTQSGINLASAITGNITIVSNNFFGASSTGISLTNTTANMNVLIASNQFSTFEGIGMTPSSGTVSIAIVSNQFSPFPNSTMDSGIVMHATSARVNVLIKSNTFENILHDSNSIGIDLLADSSTLNALISKNLITNVGGLGIDIENSATGSTYNIDMESNRVVNANMGGIAAAGIFFNTSSTTNALNVRLSDNFSTALNGAPGYDILQPSSNNMKIQSPNLQVSGLEAINFGTFSFPNGTAGITFVPFTLTPLF